MDKEVCKDEYSYKDDKVESAVYTHVYDFKPIEKGERFDVISKLTTFGNTQLLIRNEYDGNNNMKESFVGVETQLSGKNILLCSLFVPSNCPLYSFSLLSSELLSEPYKFNTEIVIVPKMRPGFEYDDNAFDNLFFTHFPAGCLAVPFRHYNLCDYLFQYLKFDNGKLRAIFVDADQIVLQNDATIIFDYGANGFPFSDDRFNLVSTEFEDEYVPFSYLDEFLLCPPSLSLSGLSDPHISTTVDQLRNKLVGLYMFRIGNKFHHILDVYHSCKKQGIEFEIVLVSLPFSDHIHPEKLQYIVNDNINNTGFDTTGWWFFPYRNSSCLRLWNVAQCITFHGDSMFIVDPANKIIDFNGGKIIKNFGIKGYPFTRESLINQYVKKKQEITLDKLFTHHGSVNYLHLQRRNSCEKSEQVPVASLLDKNVLVCLDYTPRRRQTFPSLFHIAVNLYAEIKEFDTDIVLVSIFSANNATDCNIKDCDPYVEWLERPYDGDRPMLDFPLDSLLAFRKGGHLHSISPLDLVKNNGLQNCIPFSRDNCDLRHEVICELGASYGFMSRLRNPDA